MKATELIPAVLAERSLFPRGEQLAIATGDGGSSPAPPPSLGLSRLHKCPHAGMIPTGDFLISVAEGGGVAWVSEVLPGRPGPKDKPERGRITGFSRSSRLRMIEQVQRIDRREVRGVYFDTLTTRRGSLGWRGLELERRNFLKRFARRWGKTGWFIVWKKEPHKSGWPHLHLLIFWLTEPPKLTAFRAWQDDAWASCVAGDDVELREKVRKAGCTCVAMKSWNGVAAYVAKYCTKEVEELATETGRIWGIANRRQLPETIRTEHVGHAEGVRVRRVLRKLQQRRRETWYVLAEGEWHRVRNQRQYVPGSRAAVVVTIAEQLRIARVAGVRVKRRRARVSGNLVVPIWSEVTETKNGRERRWIEKEGDELQAVCSARHFVKPETVLALLTWAKSEVRRRVEFNASCPI